MMESANSDHKNNDDLIITIPLNQNSTTAESMGPSLHQFEEFKDEDNSTKALHIIQQNFIEEEDEDETKEDPAPKETPIAQ